VRRALARPSPAGSADDAQPRVLRQPRTRPPPAPPPPARRRRCPALRLARPRHRSLLPLRAHHRRFRLQLLRDQDGGADRFRRPGPLRAPAPGPDLLAIRGHHDLVLDRHGADRDLRVPLLRAAPQPQAEGARALPHDLLHARRDGDGGRGGDLEVDPRARVGGAELPARQAAPGPARLAGGEPRRLPAWRWSVSPSSTPGRGWATTSSSSSPACRTSRSSSTRRRASTARGAGSSSGT